MKSYTVGQVPRPFLQNISINEWLEYFQICQFEWNIAKDQIASYMNVFNEQTSNRYHFKPDFGQKRAYIKTLSNHLSVTSEIIFFLQLKHWKSVHTEYSVHIASYKLHYRGTRPDPVCYIDCGREVCSRKQAIEILYKAEILASLISTVHQWFSENLL